MDDSSTIIIGAGPAGSSAAIYLAQFLHPVVLLDRKAGYKRTKLAMGMENYLSYEKPIKGEAFLGKIDKQLKKFPVIRASDEVIRASLNKNGLFVVKTRLKRVFISKYLIIAVGLKDGTLNLPYVDKYYNSSIFHCMTCNWFKNKDKKIAVVGNADSAITNALIIKNLKMPPELVVVPTQIPSFSPSLIRKAGKENIKVMNSPLKKLLGSNKVLKILELENGQRLDIDVLFTTLGMERVDHFLDEGNILPERDRRGFIKVNFKNFETSIKNMFAVGPCNNGPDQAIIAAGQGAVAALEIHKRIINYH